ncbi:MAG: ABC transporter substrate-binding protein [Acidimicrobiales bacterium]
MSPHVDRRSFLLGGAALAGGLALGAQIAGEGGAGAVRTNGPGRNGVGIGRPRRGGNLNIGVNAEEQGFNPASGRFDTTGFMYGRTVFDPLMVVTATGGVVPYLAQSVVPNADFTVWTVTARSGVTFHDGTPLDGAALLQNLTSVYNSPLTGIALKPIIAGFRQSGPLSIQIMTRHPYVTFPYTLAESQVAYIAAPSMLDAPNGGTDNPIGTGPFKFQEWVPNSHFTATANSHYWRPNQPYLNSVTFKPVPDANARAEALQSGEVDMIHLDEAQQMLEFRGNRQWSYADNSGATVGSPTSNLLMLNLSKPPFNNANLRVAVAKGINRAQISRVLEFGVNAPSTGLYQPGSPYYQKTTYPDFDPAGARRMVRQIARRTGAPVSFTLNTLAAPTTIRDALFIQQAMQNIGITMKIAEFDQTTVINNALYGSFEATEWMQFGATSPDLNYVWFSTTTVNDNGLSINMARNVDPRIEAAMLTGTESVDAKTRIAAFSSVNEFLAQDLPYLWTTRATWALVSTPSVMNWNSPTSPGGTPTLANNEGVWWLNQIWLS